jgi:response regulator RpfG family c-di-GMP phosphodiesterase
MYRLPLRDRPTLASKKVLLIDRFRATREARAAVLRSRGVEVDEAEGISAARFLWQPDVYDLVMFDIRRYSREEAFEFYEQIRAANPRQRIVFLTGPPRYVSRTWPGEIAEADTSRSQWGETVKRFLAAA